MSTLRLDDGIIRVGDGGGAWTLPLRDVLVIGEATTDAGPFADDYWLCFATGPDEWHEASFYSDGREEFLKALELELGGPIQLGLVRSTDFASRVLWPEPLTGRPMFEYRELWSKSRLARAAQKLLGGPRSNTQSFTREVEGYLRAAKPR